VERRLLSYTGISSSGYSGLTAIERAPGYSVAYAVTVAVMPTTTFRAAADDWLRLRRQRRTNATGGAVGSTVIIAPL